MKKIIDDINKVKIPRTKNKYINFLIDNFNKGTLFWHLTALAIFLLLFGFDWMTKGIVYDAKLAATEINETQANWGIIAWSSYLHKNTTVFSALEISMPLWVNITMDWFILIGFAILPHFLTSKKHYYFATAVIASGVLGNGLDRMVFGGVRDIMFTPWWNQGIFNFADVQLVVGAGYFILVTIVDLFNDYKKEKEEKNMSIEIIDETDTKHKIVNNVELINEKEKSED